jgi:hypothetical protein
VDILDDLAIDDASFWTSVWEQNWGEEIELLHTFKGLADFGLC